jgi:hypothetical protein
MTVSVEAFFFAASELTIFFLNLPDWPRDNTILQGFKKTDKIQKEINFSNKLYFSGFILCQVILNCKV